MSFDTTFERVQNAIDKTYSVQKSTFKGFSAFFKEFGRVHRHFSNDLLKLSQNAGDHLGLKLPLTECVKQENPAIKTIISELLYAVQVLSHLHLNFSERLQEISQTFTQQYETVKRTKQTFMDALYKTYPQALKSNPGRQTQSQILKNLFQMLDKLEEDEIGRTQRTRQNSIIFYSMYKKIVEKQTQVAISNGTRIGKMEVESTRKQLNALLKEVMKLNDGYPGATKLSRKNEKIPIAQSTLRSSLRMTRTDQTVIRIQQNQNILQNLYANYEQEQSKIMFVTDDLFQSRRGLLSKDMKNYYSIVNHIKIGSFSQIVYAMFESFYVGKMAEHKSDLMGIKVRLKLSEYKAAREETRTFQQFIEKQYQNRTDQQRRSLAHLINISLYHCCQLSEEDLLKRLNDPAAPLPKIDLIFHPWVSAVFLDMLLETLFKSREDEIFLISGYGVVFKLIAMWGIKYLQVQPQMPLLLFFIRVLRQAAFRDEMEIEPNLTELQTLLDPEDFTQKSSDLTVNLKKHVRNIVSNQILEVYKPNTHPNLKIQITYLLDISCKENSLQKIMACLRLSGYRYLLSKDPDRALFGLRFESSDKVKILSQVVRSTDFRQLSENILTPLAQSICQYFSLSIEKILPAVRQRFFSFIIEIIMLNINTINDKNLTDKDGHILTLGIEICKIDQLSPQNPNIFQNYFKILEVALVKMEQQYKELLNQTKTTQLWLIQENMYATQNCFDFCSLLAKPIQFMTKALRETEMEGHRSDFREKFVQAIKIKLNQILHTEVIQYVVFLQNSLKKFDVQEPRVSIDGRKFEFVPANQQQQKQSYNVYKQLCRRLTNLIFIKQQINQIVRDLFEPELFQRIGGQVFQLPNLQAEKSRASRSQIQLLSILSTIVREILTTEERIMIRATRATVFTFLRKFFERLYFRRKDENKLSENTLMNMKEEVEDYFLLIQRNVPSELIDKFYVYVLAYLAIGIKCEMLNPQKTKMNIAPQALQRYFQTDIVNFLNSLKRCCTTAEETMTKAFYQPIKGALEALKDETKTLFSRYEQALLSKNQNQCDEVLTILYLRAEQDKKAKQFVKKYRPQ